MTCSKNRSPGRLEPRCSSIRAAVFTTAAASSTPGLRRLVVMLQYVTPLAFILPEDDFRGGTSFRHLYRPHHDQLTALVLGAR